ncbi:methylamine dehydrogenase light chain [Paraburkholderia pallida]|uniref:Amine dehydrogenase n=1 Tax=Paraburkholderia pallida TaxID=2547399 RepID=A0A4P7D399_9BURK|nr:methylamine dehydrogenase light chain [Paraburkholderia pallida]QBR03301.1 amine dehydrogenase [Paraburkholderia pallida]
MALFDLWFERSARSVASRTSRRSAMATLGKALVGSALAPLLPVDRTANAAPVTNAKAGVSDDPMSCDYWKYCAIDGFLCSCCGGTSSSCPPGTTASPITWIGTCRNPHDGSDYIVSYNDCCGKTSCSNCFCNRNERERPLYKLSLNNDINWCMASSNSNYHCSVSVLLGAAKQ